jgi:hypothetical protein
MFALMILFTSMIRTTCGIVVGTRLGKTRQFRIKSFSVAAPGVAQPALAHGSEARFLLLLLNQLLRGVIQS